MDRSPWLVHEADIIGDFSPKMISQDLTAQVKKIVAAYGVNVICLLETRVQKEKSSAILRSCSRDGIGPTTMSHIALEGFGFSPISSPDYQLLKLLHNAFTIKLRVRPNIWCFAL